MRFMRRHLFLLSFIVAMTLSSCHATIDPDGIKQPPELIAWYDSLWKARFDVSPENVRQYLKLNPHTKTAENVDITPIAPDGETLAYLLSTENGWELLSADKRMPPVLAYGRDAGFPADNAALTSCLSADLETISCLKKGLVSIPADDAAMLRNLAFWFIIQPDYIPATKADGDPEEEEKFWELIDSQWVGDFEDATGHLIQTRWHQDSPWNMFSPLSSASGETRDPAGCTAIAAAQLLFFLHGDIGRPVSAPTEGSCTGYAANLTDTTYSQTFSAFSSEAWENMATKYLDIVAGKSDTLSALWIGFVGKSVDTRYSPTVSQAYFAALPAFFLTQGVLSSLPLIYDGDVVYDAIRQTGQPAILSAHATRTMDFWGNITYQDGHTFLADAATAAYTVYDRTYVWTSQTQNDLYSYGQTKVVRDTVLSGHYLKMNWGLGDTVQDNVNYSADASHFRTYIGEDLYDFQYHLRMIHGFSELQ